VSHPEQRAFFAAVASASRQVIKGGRVLEIGSYDVNGRIRDLLLGCADYVGVDLHEGPGVDLVAYGHQVDSPDGSYDIALSGECFEHDPHWRATFANMVRMTRPGGLVTFTCASRGRPEHGTTRTFACDSPGTQSEGLDYYRNLVADDFGVLPLGEWFSRWRFWYMPTSFDLYFAGVRTGEPSGAVADLPSDIDVYTIRRLMSVPHRAARLPLRVVRCLISDDERYQRVILPYWLRMLKWSGSRADRAQAVERSADDLDAKCQEADTVSPPSS
jgi:SAM-dependent methyltransferase